VPSPEREITRATCAGCGCLCDDVDVEHAGGRLERLSGTCPLGDAWFAARAGEPGPAARIDGREAPLDEALDEAAAILSAARFPLVYGLGATSIEAQREAVALADVLGAVVGPSGPVRDGALGAAFTTVGASTATFGEIRDRAQLVVVWRADPAATHPRLLERLRLDRASRAGRALVVVGAAGTPTAHEADEVIELGDGLDLEALWATRALARGIDPGDDARLPVGALRALAERLRSAGHAAVLLGAGIAAAEAGRANVHALHALVRDLDRETHVVTLALRSDGNALGAEDVLAWQTGYPAAVGLAAGHPRSDAFTLDAAAVLAGGDADAALIVAADARHELPAPAAERLALIPTVVVDARETDTAAAARVALRSAAAGVHVAGTAHRMDGVPVALRAPLASPLHSDEQLLRALRDRIDGSAAC
jgi:formylmethanofuran dehydrogenase subunit B